MPIGDLLAQITGERPKAVPPPAVSRGVAAPPPKRKAEDNLVGATPKAIRTEARPTSATNGSSRLVNDTHSSSRPIDRPIATSRPSPGQSVPGSTPSRRPINTPSKPAFTALSQPNGNKSATRSKKAAGNVSSPTTQGSDATSSAVPKKGSYAEIMARAKQMQTTMGPVGKIQHKPLVRSMTMKERKELKREEARAMRKGTRPGSRGTTEPLRKGVNGGAVSLPSRERNGNGDIRRPQTGDTSKATNGKISRPVLEEKKMKKSAVATTGYTGTARPRPGASKPGDSSSKVGAASSSAKVRNGRPFGAFSAPSRSRRDDYDEELDDFIEYDDEEDEAGPPGYGARNRGRYDYDSEEDESDMEAGLSDIDEEERRAEHVARREDQEQEALEKRLKREKEERKQRFLQEARARRR